MPLQLSHPRLAPLLAWEQSGVVARRQILAAGGTDRDIARLIRRRELSPILPGVYVNHTGAPTWQQRAWAAVLATWPAGLTEESALRWRPPRYVGTGLVLVAVAADRRLTPPAGVIVRRSRHFAEQVFTATMPPQILNEHAVLSIAVRELRRNDVAAAYAALARAVGDRAVTTSRLADALTNRERVPRRALLSGMVEDLLNGAHSVLERGYLRLVERAHGLPRGTRQQRSTATGRTTFADVKYAEQRLLVELDGLQHDTDPARDADAARDLAGLAVSGDVTVRLTYGQVYRDTCRTARMLADILTARGWAGIFAPCPHCPPA